MTVTRERLIQLHAELTTRARELMQRKNEDYANAGDAFGNLRNCETMGVASMSRGILIRMTDKVQRLVNLLERPPSVTDEGFADTILDVINYAVLLEAARQDRLPPEGALPAAAGESPKLDVFCVEHATAGCNNIVDKPGKACDDCRTHRCCDCHHLHIDMSMFFDSTLGRYRCAKCHAERAKV